MNDADKDKAIETCRAAGQNPHGYTDYSDLGKGIQNWEYFLPAKPEKANITYRQTRIELLSAEQFGFEKISADCPRYICTESQLIAFARACERAALVRAVTVATVQSSQYDRGGNSQENALAGECDSIAHTIGNLMRFDAPTPEQAARQARIDTLVRNAREHFESLSPEQQDALSKQQAESWVRGEMELGL